MLKLNYGLFGARNLSEIQAHARQAYDDYYRKIRDAVPAERRLEYTMGDGWEPLCAFLGKEIPDLPFPRLNDGAARQKNQQQGEMMVLFNSAKKVSLLVLGVVAVVAALWWTA
ncbi:hypothetical protein NQ176_g2117 [Zarea fungicola]|uniref:Uncharacterized protein n=1 Tax=Zarea fungicola TaxID=93591 RepID=A0ACC1NQE8_9HYPO|nr:hypothetical protein NQ176_g2117 [Lecanicillium fungicola]